MLGQERRRRWSIEEKLAMVRESLVPGQSVSVMATRNGINPSQLSHWRKLYQGGSLTAVSSGEATDGSNQTNPGSIESSTAVCVLNDAALAERIKALPSYGYLADGRQTCAAPGSRHCVDAPPHATAQQLVNMTQGQLGSALHLRMRA